MVHKGKGLIGKLDSERRDYNTNDSDGEGDQLIVAKVLFIYVQSYQCK